MNKPHHNTGRRNAAKTDDERKDSHIHIRCKTKDKALIVRNLNHGETLASFMLMLAVDEAARRQGNE